jgi:hypothetical protein
MTLRGEGVPKVCSHCDESYWEEMCYGEDAFCGKYKMLCVGALKECELISINKCCDCSRNG